MDQYPYREDGAAAVRESVSFLRDLEALLTDACYADLRCLIASGDATATIRYVRELLFGKHV